MAKDERALAIMDDRKMVLGILNMRYPNFVPGETIFKTMIGLSTEYTKRRLIRDLTYFNEKGYVKYKDTRGIDPVAITVNHCAYCLTADGLDVANRLVEDPALDV